MINSKQKNFRNKMPGFSSIKNLTFHTKQFDFEKYILLISRNFGLQKLLPIISIPKIDLDIKFGKTRKNFDEKTSFSSNKMNFFLTKQFDS